MAAYECDFLYHFAEKSSPSPTLKFTSKQIWSQIFSCEWEII